VLVALVLTPALCATLLKPPKDGADKHHGGFFGWFNRGFNRANRDYANAVQHMTRKTGRWLIV
jgi:multidrug efflux pump subunit AcrB